MQNMADALSANRAAMSSILVMKNLIGGMPISKDGGRIRRDRVDRQCTQSRLTYGLAQAAIPVFQGIRIQENI